ncbi:CinA family protein [Idiomarina seosinensis]|uniref:CinA family protein n=1 Tax=Idiomarina seosinensis TaxID=281739 RepID=UPI00384AC4A6
MITSQQNWAQLVKEAGELGQLLSAKKQTVATAESCTGGGIGYLLTEVTGSSAWFSGGLIVYTNALKQQWLGVTDQALAEGAVSAPCVEAMALGAKRTAATDWAVSVSGVAGPGGGSEDKPVGLVWMAIAGPDQCISFAKQFQGDRTAVRLATLNCVLTMLIKKVSQ